jgi:hypothetical protein
MSKRVCMRSGAMRKSVLILVCGLAALTAATAFASARATPTSRTAVPKALVGTWGKTITYATWHRNQIFYEAAGHWGFAMTSRGVASIYEPPGKPDGYRLTTMHVAVAGATVVFGPTADGFCSGKAAYRWKVSGRTLTFTTVKDDCDARRVFLSAGGWIRA